MREMREVIGGCKVCGKQMLTDRSPLRHRNRRENHRRTDARRKAERHAAKAAMKTPRCEQCGEAITGAVRLAYHGKWARRFCGNTCRQAAFRDRRCQPDML